MKALYDLKEKLQRDLDEIARKPEMNAGDLTTAEAATQTVENSRCAGITAGKTVWMAITAAVAVTVVGGTAVMMPKRA